MSELGWKADIALPVATRHYRNMYAISERAELIRAACLAHVIGLVVVGFYGTVGTSSGFGSGAWVGAFVGGIISIPWFAALCAVIWFFADFYSRNLIAMCVVGPAVVCGTWWLLDGSDLIDAVAITSIVGSAAFLTIMALRRWRNARET
jgi:hypothetical protein